MFDAFCIELESATLYSMRALTVKCILPEKSVAKLSQIQNTSVQTASLQKILTYLIE